VIGRWKDDRSEWLAHVMRTTAEKIEENQDTKVPPLELRRMTVRKIKEGRSTGIIRRPPEEDAAGDAT